MFSDTQHGGTAAAICVPNTGKISEEEAKLWENTSLPGQGRCFPVGIPRRVGHGHRVVCPGFAQTGAQRRDLNAMREARWDMDGKAPPPPPPPDCPGLVGPEEQP